MIAIAMAGAQQGKQGSRSRSNRIANPQLSHEIDVGIGAVEEFVKHMWDFGNVITAFTVAQSLTGIYFILEKPQLVNSLRSYATPGAIVIAAGAILYCLTAWSCYRVERQLRCSVGQPRIVLATSRMVMRARIATILMFNFIFISIGLIAAARRLP